MNVLDKVNQKEIARLSEGKNIPDFSAGDTIRVNVNIREGSRERVQAFEGVCIARSGSGMDASFTVRKISFGEGVERTFPLYSPRLDSIDLVRRGSVRRAKLYYLRDRSGKSARIAERTTGHGIAKKGQDTSKTAAKSKTQAKKERIANKKAKKSA